MNLRSLFQVEYAIEAVKLGSTAVGIQTREGVVLAIEKRLTSSLLEPSSVEKVLEIDSHIGAAFSGLIGGNSISRNSHGASLLRRNELLIGVPVFFLSSRCPNIG